ncbi:MAG: hypothetical protein R3185_08090, partial [Candidatus Thermoplasmatota archaeon]|nr:hypothetical protein [Candidatus Thermoplasmatota archaeon]
MGDACCGSDTRPDHFHCHGCGSCCNTLQERWNRDRGQFRALPGQGVYRLPTPGGLRMFSWEATPFQGHGLQPLLVVADAQRDAL